MTEVQAILFKLKQKKRLLREGIQQRHVINQWMFGSRMDLVYYLTWELKMAVKGKAKEEYVEAKFTGFFNVEIPTDEKDKCKQFIREDEQVGLHLEEALASGYKFSLKRNEKTDTVIASMQCMDAKSPNAGLVMSAYAKHWYEAIGVVLWKHFFLCKQQWEKPEVDFDTDIG